jgi:hypothetical protein
MKEQIRYFSNFGRDIKTAIKEQDLENEQTLVSYLFLDKKTFEVIDSKRIISEEQYSHLAKEKKNKIIEKLKDFCVAHEITLEEVKIILKD